MRKWVNFPLIEGETSRQAHADLPPGTFEREISKEGFFGPATHIYHKHPPTNWSDFEGPLRPHAFDTNKWQHDGASPWYAKTLLQNNDVKIRFWSTAQAMDHLVRNGDGDELLFVHDGSGDLYSDFGRISYRDGDYLVIPRGTMWRLEPAEKTDLLLIESSGSSFSLPEKGLLGPHALFDPAIIDTPHIDEKFKAQQTEESWQIRIKARGRISTITFPFNPLDAQGWKGDLTVMKVNWRDIRPVMSHRYHLPPSVHTTFVGGNFVVCTFCPRPIESDPDALKVPFFHNNDDYDEFIFYHRGQFFSRDNIHPGMTSYHPMGFTHGPHPKAFAAGKTSSRKETDEVAVMVDARHPLDISEDAAEIEWGGYVDSWKPAKAAE